MFLPVFYRVLPSSYRVLRCGQLLLESLLSPSNYVILHWKTSGAEDIPKGNRFKQNLPNGVIKVVSNRLSSSNSIWWNPLAGSNFENIFEPFNWGDIPAIGLMCKVFANGPEDRGSIPECFVISFISFFTASTELSCISSICILTCTYLQAISMAFSKLRSSLRWNFSNNSLLICPMTKRSLIWWFFWGKSIFW